MSIINDTVLHKTHKISQVIYSRAWKKKEKLPYRRKKTEFLCSVAKAYVTERSLLYIPQFVLQSNTVLKFVTQPTKKEKSIEIRTSL